MKYMLLLGALSAVLIMHVECRSFMECTEECDVSSCTATDRCTCGTHLGECGCCSYCNVCRNQECSFVTNDQCEDGYRCQRPEQRSGLDYYNLPGVCMRTQ